jgi:N-acyl amino acid synthase of PEP-CTERM/exosortase system
MLDEAFRLRHRVYCLENDFESPANGDCIERDEFDEHAVHSVVLDRTSETVIATVRLTLPYSDEGQVTLPVQRLCKDLSEDDHHLFRTGRAAEISRFAISKELRRRTGAAVANSAEGRGVSTPSRLTEWCEQSFIALGLLRAVFQMSLNQGITHLYAVMEPALLRLISRVGLKFKPVGPLVQYHGARQPSHGEIHQLLAQLETVRPDIWHFLKSAEERTPWERPQMPQAELEVA